MRYILDPSSPEAQKAPGRVLSRAKAEGKKVLRVVWDEKEGYPEHAWGYTQWSIRPYEQRYGCDGTTDSNIHLIALRLCEALNLDYSALYEKAYGKEENWLEDYDWQAVEKETIVPELSEQALRGLLYDLGEINNRSLLNVLKQQFECMGYDVENWWERTTASNQVKD